MQLLGYFKTATLESDKDYFFEVLWYTCTETVLFQDTVTLFNFAKKKLTTQPSHIIFRTKNILAQGFYVHYKTEGIFE